MTSLRQRLSIDPETAEELFGCYMAAFYAMIFATGLTSLLGVQTVFSTAIPLNWQLSVIFTVFGMVGVVIGFLYAKEKWGFTRTVLPNSILSTE